MSNDDNFWFVGRPIAWRIKRQHFRPLELLFLYSNQKRVGRFNKKNEGVSLANMMYHDWALQTASTTSTCQTFSLRNSIALLTW